LPAQAAEGDDDNTGLSVGRAWPTEFDAWTGQGEFESGDHDASVVIGSDGGLKLAEGAAEGRLELTLAHTRRAVLVACAVVAVDYSAGNLGRDRGADSHRVH
jgi:hypothetical protein